MTVGTGPNALVTTAWLGLLESQLTIPSQRRTRTSQLTTQPLGKREPIKHLQNPTRRLTQLAKMGKWETFPRQITSYNSGPTYVTAQTLAPSCFHTCITAHSVCRKHLI